MSTTQPQIVFITGTSASGKTTLFESLRADSDFTDTDFHDIDEDGTPPVGREPWRQYRIANLLYEASRKIEAGRSTIICGITKPHEVLESEHYKAKLPVRFILTEVSDAQIDKRLRTRAQQQAVAEKWDESTADIDRMISSNLRLKKILHNSILALKEGFVIDASELSKPALHDRAKEIIKNEGKR